MPPKSTTGNGKRRRDSTRTGDAEDVEVDEDCPACQSCRKRKAKCSRQQPCHLCLKLDIDCVYDDKKQRPGMRPGAIEGLNQRLVTLEQMFLGQGVLLQPLLEGAMSNGRPMASCQADSILKSVKEQCSLLKSRLVSASEYDLATSQDHTSSASKRQRTSSPESAQSSEPDVNLPPLDTLNDIVEYYFRVVHPWMPILHVRLFRQQLHDEKKRGRLTSILQAIVSLCLRFSDSAFAKSVDIESLCRRYRNAVILQGIERFSVENLQAMTIIAFDIIGSGRGPSAWSLVGSMARTAEQLQLSVEDAEPEEHTKGHHSDLLIQRMSFLAPAQTWIESEERRRVFWNVFLMDRFCSVATGWNNSLTNADVRRRLPCEGAIWEEGVSVRTPYFGIAERSNLSAEQVSTPNSGRHAANEEEVDSLGGFAFCIEATESLNLVTTFFLRQPVRFSQAQQFQLWLMNFKELDLRLVKWRLFLPSRWGNASVLNEHGIMDPNLTLAHITHNTAVIQLHQTMAYPPLHFQKCPVPLPSVSSSETCVTAAAEISTIAKQYLSMSEGITNPQFSFCLFIAGRMLLAHSVYYHTPLHASFDDLLSSLVEIARRWAGTRRGKTRDSLANRFALRLRCARGAEGSSKCPDKKTQLDIYQPVYSGEDEHQAVTAPLPGFDAPQDGTFGPSGSIFEHSPSSLSMAYPPLPQAFNHADYQHVNRTDGGYDHGMGESHDITGNLSHDTNTEDQYSSTFLGAEFDSLDGLFDQPFEQMLRVSTYGGTQDFTDNSIQGV